MSLVAIDCRFASQHAGLGRYTRELVHALVARDDPWEYGLIVKSAQEPWIAALPKKVRTIETSIPHYSLKEQTELMTVVHNLQPSLLFSPHFNVPLLINMPYIVTVHDLILHRFPNRASLLKKIGYRLLMKRAVQHASAVLTVSSFVAQELTSTYGEDIASKMHVTFEGVNPHFAPRSEADIAAVRAKHKLTSPYFLYVGNAKQHKNVPLLLEAFAKAELPDTQLILVSGGEEAKRLSLPVNVRLLAGISDDDLPALYAGATAFVTASLYEGFCLPAAEALACGCPVIAVNRGPLPEVTGGHALLIEPTVDAFVDAFRNPPSNRTPQLLWDWKKAADRTATVMHGILKP